MISIQSAMLIALGFLAATLLALLLAPAFLARAVRLTTRRLRDTLPVNEAEVRAERDRLRAEYAITVHTLEQRAENAELTRARNLIEINRRDATISRLESDNREVRTRLEEYQNARRVLEQTIADRLPKVEQRLSDAKTSIFNRDRDIAELTQTAKKHLGALDEAKSINAQQTAEIERLMTALTTRGARNKQAMADPSFEGELALRAEIEALRAKARDQAALINRLQLGPQRGGVAAGNGARSEYNGANGVNGNGHGAMNGSYASAVAALSDVGANLVAELAAAGQTPPGDDGREIRLLNSTVQDQAAELARLKAALRTYENETPEAAISLRDSKIALRARLSAVQAEAEQQAETIKRLRAEAAASNERLALQSAHFMEEMRRLGAGTLPASSQTRRPSAASAKRSLADRVAETRPQSQASSAARARAANGNTAPPVVAAAAAKSAVNGASGAAGTKNGNANGSAPVLNGSVPAAANGKAEGGNSSLSAIVGAAAAPSAAIAAAETAAIAAQPSPEPSRSPPKGKSRLLDRISSLSKA